jgi:hypothetical protein
MAVEISKRNYLMTVVSYVLLMSGLVFSVICEQVAVSIAIITVSCVLGLYLALQVRIKRQMVMVVPPNQIKILGYEMKEVEETKIRV